MGTIDEIRSWVVQKMQTIITNSSKGVVTGEFMINARQLLDFLDSLSVDAPDFPTTDEEMEKFLANTPPVEVPDKYKNPDWLFKRPMKDAPEVFDFEKELEAYHQGYWPKTDNGDESLTYSPNAIRRLVAHFFELGLNEKPDAPEGLDEAADIR